MVSDSDILNFLFRLYDIAQKEKEIKNIEQALALAQARGEQQIALAAQLSNSKQTLEVIRLTRDIRLLTIALVAIGVVQILIMLKIIKVG